MADYTKEVTAFQYLTGARYANLGVLTKTEGSIVFGVITVADGSSHKLYFNDYIVTESGKPVAVWQKTAFEALHTEVEEA